MAEHFLPLQLGEDTILHRIMTVTRMVAYKVSTQNRSCMAFSFESQHSQVAAIIKTMVLTPQLTDNSAHKTLCITVIEELKIWNEKGQSVTSPTVCHSLRTAALRPEAGSTTVHLISEHGKLGWCHSRRHSSVNWAKNNSQQLFDFFDGRPSVQQVFWLFTFPIF